MNKPTNHLHSGHSCSACGAPRRHNWSYVTDDILLVDCAECIQSADFAREAVSSREQQYVKVDEAQRRLDALDRLLFTIGQLE